MRLLPKEPPPGPSDPGFWQSPLRGPWLTAFLGSVLLVLIAVVALTGQLSHAAYEPDLGRNAIVPRDEDLDVSWLDWPTSPSWLYAVTQGLHVTVGIVAVPLLLAKLWSVIPKLFQWPPLRSPAQALERVALLALVGGALFMFATGIANAQYWYPFGFDFVVAHYYGSFVFLSALVLHVLTKLPAIRAAYADRGVLKPLLDRETQRTPEPEDDDPTGLVAPVPEPATISRRGLIGLTGAAMGGLLVTTAGQSIGGPLRSLAVLAPRGAGVPGDGPNGFLVNKTAAQAKITPAMTGAGWRLELNGGRRLSRGDLLGMDLHTAELPIACVEGWSTTQTWTGVRLRDLAELAGRPGAETVLVQSLQEGGAFRQVTLSRDAIEDGDSLLALRVNGVDLSPDHGFPARIMVPAKPGVHQTKWVASLDFA